MCLQNPNVRLYCKGANSSVLPLTTPTLSNTAHTAQTLPHLQSFASENLRTLVVAQRDFDGPAIEAFLAWEKRHHHTLATLKTRQAQMDASLAEIERYLFLVGATAIEKKLQEGMLDCLEIPKRTGINV